VRESRYWLRLLDTSGVEGQERERHWLIGEATELAKIFSSILQRSE
jgi:hypothetical protein